MKTAMEVIAGVLSTLAIAVAIFYFAWLSPPAVEDVCGNVERVALHEVSRRGDRHGPSRTELTAQVKMACLELASTAPEFGRAVWVKRLKCMRDAHDMVELKSCDYIRSL